MSSKTLSFAMRGSVKTSPKNRLLLKRLYILSAAVLTITYVVLAFLPPPAESVLKLYNLTPVSYRLIILPIILVFVVIWLAGFYGYLNIKRYSSLIKGSPDGNEMNSISNGILVLSLSLPIGSVFGEVAALLDRGHLSWVPTLTIITNYINLALMAMAFALIAKGSENLYNTIRRKVRPIPQRAWMFLFITISCLYSYFIVVQPFNAPQAARAYYLPNILLILTIVIPYLYFWYRGINAGYCIFLYQKNIKGKLYKNSLNLLAAGIVMVIISSIVTRGLTTVSTKLSQLDLTPLLFIVYGLLIIDGAGYILIAAGARRLRRIEEV